MQLYPDTNGYRDLKERLPEDVIQQLAEITDQSDQKTLVPIDPNKFYVLLGKEMDRHEIYDLVRHLADSFNTGKGEMIVLNCRGNLKDYTLEDLILMRDSLSKLITVAEKKNKVSMSRYDIIKETAKNS